VTNFKVRVVLFVCVCVSAFDTVSIFSDIRDTAQMRSISFVHTNDNDVLLKEQNCNKISFFFIHIFPCLAQN